MTPPSGESRSSPGDLVRRRIPEATVARLPRYLRALAHMEAAGSMTVSSRDLAQISGVNPANVRKDLSSLGSYGTRGVGYGVQALAAEIQSVLGLTRERAVVIVGIGNLGSALASYGGFDRRGFEVVALVDSDPDKVGLQVAGKSVRAFAEVGTIVREHAVSTAVLATPEGAAQSAADVLVEAGVTAILNFAPAHLEVPESVTVRSVDLATELQILAFYDQHESSERSGQESAPPAAATG